MNWSQFTAHFVANKRSMPAAVAAEIGRTAKARVAARWQAGRADCALDFTDLVDAIEKAVMGA